MGVQKKETASDWPDLLEPLEIEKIERIMRDAIFYLPMVSRAHYSGKVILLEDNENSSKKKQNKVKLKTTFNESAKLRSTSHLSQNSIIKELNKQMITLPGTNTYLSADHGLCCKKPQHSELCL